MYLSAFFPFGLVTGMWDLIILVFDHCLSFYFPFMILFAIAATGDVLCGNR